MSKGYWNIGRKLPPAESISDLPDWKHEAVAGLPIGNYNRIGLAFHIGDYIKKMMDAIT